MTANKDLKFRIRERQKSTGESYSTARLHVLRARDQLLGLPEAAPAAAQEDGALEAIVLKVNERSARVRLLSDGSQVTLRSSDACDLVPGHLLSIKPTKRWTWHGDAYASGDITRTWLDVPRLGLTPLPLKLTFPAMDVRKESDPYEAPDPYAPLWRALTDKPRDGYEFDPIAWGALPDESDPDENPTCDASELAEEGDEEGAREIWMNVLLRDLRVIEAHVGLGNLEFERCPEYALLHYEVGVRIGELSLPAGFDGLLPWGRIYNRPFLRSLHGYGLCLWRQKRNDEALRVFERLLSLSPNDNQGNRFCWNDLRNGLTWEQMGQGLPARGARKTAGARTSPAEPPSSEARAGAPGPSAFESEVLGVIRLARQRNEARLRTDPPGDVAVTPAAADSLLREALIRLPLAALHKLEALMYAGRDGLDVVATFQELSKDGKAATVRTLEGKVPLDEYLEAGLKLAGEARLDLDADFPAADASAPGSFVIDMGHMAEALAPGSPAPAPARALAEFVAAVVVAGSEAPRGRTLLTALACRRSCPGKVAVRTADDRAPVEWQCPECGEQGVISNWQVTLWDARPGKSAVH